MANDPYKSTVQSADSFGTKSRVVIPGPADIDPVPKAIVMLAAGDVTVVPVNNADADTIAFSGLAAGQTIPLRVRRVTAASAGVATVED